MVDNAVAIINIFSIAACATLAVTWAPLAIDTIRRRDTSMLGWIGLGLVWVAISTLSVRQYSFLMREAQMMWLRDTYIAPTVLVLQSIGLVMLAASYYLPRESSKGRLPPNFTGVWVGVFVFVLMIGAKLFL